MKMDDVEMAKVGGGEVLEAVVLVGGGRCFVGKMMVAEEIVKRKNVVSLIDNLGQCGPV